MLSTQLTKFVVCPPPKICLVPALLLGVEINGEDAVLCYYSETFIDWTI